MWQIHAQMALDLARERAEEARHNSLASQARQHAALEARLHGPLPRPSRLRLARRRGAPSGVGPVRLDQ